ncbi:MAG: hypothetical protein JXR35_10895 [Rhodobacteraceae bacterium]|nr:hypothetical protein [Paracoccaceae bacterium]
MAVFAQRNHANTVHFSDMNLFSALGFAVESRHIHEVITCDHCGYERAVRICIFPFRRRLRATIALA